MARFVSFILILLPIFAFAAEHGAEHHAEGVPKVVLYQFINVAILVVGLFYYAKDPIIQFFSNKHSSYILAAQKSAAAREQAEKQFLEIKNKIDHLAKNEADSLARARAHAEEMKQQILAEAKEVSARIQADAQMTVQLETKKAERELREQLLKDAVQAAHLVLAKDIGSQDHQKLQGDFTKSIEGMA